MVSLVRYAKEMVSLSPTKAIPAILAMPTRARPSQGGLRRSLQSKTAKPSFIDRFPSPFPPSSMPARHRHHIPAKAKRSRSHWSVHAPLESAFTMLETVTTMTRNMRATSAAVRKLLVENGRLVLRGEAYTSGNKILPPRHKAPHLASRGLSAMRASTHLAGRRPHPMAAALQSGRPPA
jgi:hypothetical protein